MSCYTPTNTGTSTNTGTGTGTNPHTTAQFTRVGDLTNHLASEFSAAVQTR